MLSKIQKDLFSFQDEEYRKFHLNLVKTSKKEIIGVRLPVLRKYAKDLLKEKEVLKFKDEYYEETMVHGLYIAGYKTSFQEKIKMIDEFIPVIDNWAICDSFASSLKYISKNKEEYFKYIKEYSKSDKEYTQRFALVVLIDHYVKDENYLDEIFNILINTKYNGYYSLMAGAWLLSWCFIYHFDKTLDFINNNKLDEFIYKKGIQKSIESFRIDDKNKEILRALR